MGTSVIENSELVSSRTQAGVSRGHEVQQIQKHMVRRPEAHSASVGAT
jgi:hypothetical protein